jgi:hypothetical protein
VSLVSSSSRSSVTKQPNESCSPLSQNEQNKVNEQNEFLRQTTKLPRRIARKLLRRCGLLDRYERKVSLDTWELQQQRELLDKWEGWATLELLKYVRLHLPDKPFEEQKKLAATHVSQRLRQRLKRKLLKKKKRKGSGPLQKREYVEDWGNWEMQPEDPSPGPLAQAVRSEQRERVRRAVAGLDEEDRELAEWVFLDGRTIEGEGGWLEFTGQTRGEARWQLERIEARLREELRDLGPRP